MLAAAAPVLYGQIDDAVERYNKAEYSEAESSLRRAVQEKPDDARAARYLGLTLLEQGKADDAARWLNKAHELEASPETRGALARLYAEKRDMKRAESFLKDAEGHDAAYARGMVAFSRRNWETAAREFDTFIEAHPSHAYAHYYAGMAYNGLRQPDKMLSHLEMFLRMKPEAPESRAVRAILRTGQ